MLHRSIDREPRHEDESLDRTAEPRLRSIADATVSHEEAWLCQAKLARDRALLLARDHEANRQTIDEYLAATERLFELTAQVTKGASDDAPVRG
jgi:hypothetical protein